MQTETRNICILLTVLVVLDLFIIGGVLWKGHANFTELYKNLK
jgi:regulatory protein YycH of two-component signal transduction system YycFG